MADRDLFGFNIGNDSYNIRDNRMENMINRHSGDGGFRGIKWDRQRQRLELVNGGWYDDGCLFENVPGEETPDEWSKKDNNDLEVQANDNAIDTDNSEWEWLSNTGMCQLWLLGVADEDGSDIDIELDIEGIFTQVETRSQVLPEYVFQVYDENDGYVDYSSQYIQAIKLVPDNGAYNLIIYFDSAIDGFNLYEAAVYLVGSEPMAWPTDLVYTDDLIGRIVAYLIDNGYISDPNAL